MIFISEVIKKLEEVKNEHGDILVRTACQIHPHTVDFNFMVDTFKNEDKTLEIKAVVIKGYKER